MLGGINLYQYAPNALIWIDLLGLACANDGKGKPHCGKGHNKTIDRIIKIAKKKGAKEIRKNQQQVDFKGNNVAKNRPELQRKTLHY